MDMDMKSQNFKEDPFQYILVTEDADNSNAVEIPLEVDGTLLLSTLVAQFPGTCGLKYRLPDSKSVRGIRLSDGKLHPPTDAGWGKHNFVCVFPKGSKRKMEDVSPEHSPAKTKRLEKILTCSDLICLGLPWKSTLESVRQYFQQFGEVAMVQLKRDKSGTFKGFGFIRFATYQSQMRALAQRHNIEGRWVDVRIPNSKEGIIPQMPCKLFVRRCTEDMKTEDLHDYFSKFGEVTDVYIPQPFRAFGFVTFLDPEVAQSLCGDHHIIKGASVSVSSAAPKKKVKSNMNWKCDNRDGFRYHTSGNSGETSNNDAINMQNLGINLTGGQPPDVSIPLNIVVDALNVLRNNCQGGPSNYGSNRQLEQPQENAKNWNSNQNLSGHHLTWMQGAGYQGWNVTKNNNWNLGHFSQGHADWEGWNKDKPPT